MRAESPSKIRATATATAATATEEVKLSFVMLGSGKIYRQHELWVTIGYN